MEDLLKQLKKNQNFLQRTYNMGSLIHKEGNLNRLMKDVQWMMEQNSKILKQIEDNE